MTVRPARIVELAPVMTVFDSGNLAVEADRVRTAVADGRLLVAVENGPVLGALLVEPDQRSVPVEIQAVAVRPGRRSQGHGSALVRAAVEHYGPLVAEFDAAVRPFWASLGFEIEPVAEPGRFVGRSAEEV